MTTAKRAQEAIDAINTALADTTEPEYVFTAWARLSGDSDIFFGKGGQYAKCISCSLYEGALYLTDRRTDAVGHVNRHREAGHALPADLVKTINREWEKS